MPGGKTVVITGGAGLLGAGFCKAVAETGDRIIVADRDLVAAQKVADGIASRGLQARAEELDITRRESVDRLIANMHARHGRIDAVVNSAYPRNRNYGRKAEEVSYEDFCENVGSHLGGYFLVAQRFGIYFQQNGGGNIVNMASVYGLIAPRFDIYEGTKMTTPVEYAAIKSAVIHLTRYFAQYFGRSGVRVNSISPGGILDNQPESFVEKYAAYCSGKGMLNVEDVAGVLLFLLSDASKHVTGQNIVVDDGFTL